MRGGACASTPAVSEDSDRHLPAIAAGDPGAFGTWVSLCESRIRASVMRFAAHLDVEAVTQECLLRVWQVAPRVEPDGRPDALLRYGIRIARNLSISELRKRAARPQGHTVDPGDENSPGAIAPIEPDPLLREVIARCRDALPGKPALALQARLEARGTRNDHELSAELGMKTNTFLKNIGRARKLLRECLESHGVRLEGESA